MPWVQNERVAAWTPARLYSSSVGALYEQLHLPLQARPTISVMLPSCWMSRQPIRALLTAIWARAEPAPPTSASANAAARAAIADHRRNDSNAPGISPPRERHGTRLATVAWRARRGQSALRRKPRRDRGQQLTHVPARGPARSPSSPHRLE